ncbi:MAG: TlpA family protein disulfide reductase [Desertimonas sp.]
MTVIMAAALVATSCGGDDSGDAVAVGGTLPSIELPALADDGEPLPLDDLVGPAVVNLWATWCQPCRRELPAFQQVSAAHTDVRFIGVDIGEDASNALDFLAEIDVDTDVFEQYGDPDSELTDALGVANLPITVVLDDESTIVDIHLGPMTVDDLEQAIEG